MMDHRLRKKNILVASFIGLAVLATIMLINDAPPTASTTLDSDTMQRFLREGAGTAAIASSQQPQQQDGEQQEMKIIDTRSWKYLLATIIAGDEDTIISEKLAAHEEEEEQNNNKQNNLDDIETWGHPASLISFDYKWKDDTCPSLSSTTTTTKKRRIALCLYGGISSLGGRFSGSEKELNSEEKSDIPGIVNFDWATAMYDANFFPEDTWEDDEEIELDLFIHSWSEEYYCSLMKSFENTRFTVRSVIAESNERHMNELVNLVTQAQVQEGSVVDAPPECGPTSSIPEKQVSMYFSMNKALALALDYSSTCEFEYDILMVARPDVLLGEPISFYTRDTKEPTSVLQALSPNNEVVHTTKSKHHYGDFHYLFNSYTAGIFVDKMFPPPSEGWPELAKLTRKICCHTGYVQEFVTNQGLVIREDDLMDRGRDEELIRMIEYHPDINIPCKKILGYSPGQWRSPCWADRFERMDLPAHCFPSEEDGVWGTDPECHPVIHEVDTCPPNQNIIAQEQLVLTQD